MTKEYFIHVINTAERNTKGWAELIKEFFDSNVCIPKGDMKHLEWVYERMLNVYACPENVDYMLKFSSIINVKPSEAIYEWQFYLEISILGEIGRTPHLTEYEFANSMSTEAGLYWQKDEETKRVRQ